MPLATLELVGGLIVLFLGGHYLVQGATTLACLARISTTVVALTVVAMGTSLPELAVSIDAAARGSTDMAYGNIGLSIAAYEDSPEVNAFDSKLDLTFTEKMLAVLELASRNVPTDSPGGLCPPDVRASPKPLPRTVKFTSTGIVRAVALSA